MRLLRRAMHVVVVLIVFVATAQDLQAQKTAKKRPKPPKPAPRAPVADPAEMGGTVAALIVRPRQVLEAPGSEMLPTEVFQAQSLDVSGIDPTQVDEVVLLVGAPMPVPTASAILRFSQPCDQQAISAKLASNAQKEAVGKGFMYRVGEPGAPSLYFADDKTLVLAPEPQLHELLSTDYEHHPLVQRLRDADPESLLSAVLVLEPLRPMLQAARGQLPPLPPTLTELAAFPDHLAAVELHVRAVPQFDLRLILEGNNEAAASRLNELIDEGIAMASQQIEAQIAELAQRGAPAVEQAGMRYANRMLGLVDKLIDRQVEGRHLVIHTEGDAVAHTGTVATLVGLLLPAVQSAREAARRTQSSNNLRQIGIAWYNYHDVHNAFPNNTYGKDGKPLLSWRVHILPYLEQTNLYNQFKLDEPWDSEHNQALIAQMPEFYRLPGNLAQAGEGKTVYLGAAGENALLGPKARSVREILDGTSNTIMVVEANPDQAATWTQPDDLEFDPANPLIGLTGLRPGGFNVLLCDGSVHFLPSSIDAETLKRLFDPDDGQPVSVP